MLCTIEVPVRGANQRCAHVGRVETPCAAEHKACGDAFFKNSEFAEQKNSFLAGLKKGAAHMRPDTLSWLLLWALYSLAAREDEGQWRKRGRKH